MRTVWRDELAKRLLTAYYGDVIGPVEQVEPTTVSPERYPWVAVLACDPSHLAVFQRQPAATHVAFVQRGALTTPTLIPPQ
jgi:hypothetical protein